MGKKLMTAYCRTAAAGEIAMRAQERQIREYAKKRGYGGLTFYRDCNKSGLTLDRPAMNALTADIKAGKIGVVIAADIARIARNFALFSEWLDLLTEYGVALVTLADGEYRPDTEISHTLAGDCLLPDIALSGPPDASPLGRYGMLHKAYLREHKSALYSRLLLTERLYPLCREVNEAARTRMRTIPDRERAHEVILSELVYN
jgi:hypothetical protein